MFNKLQQVWNLRYFWFTLAKHDLKERYRRSFIGIAWSSIKPAGMTILLTAVFTNVFDISVEEYAPFLLLGLVVWQFLSESVGQGCQSFHLGGTYLRVRPIPLAIFPLRVVLSAALHGMAGLGSAMLLIAFYKGTFPAFALIALVPGLIALGIIAWALACIAGVLHTRYADTRQIAELALQGFFYATPVIYPPAAIRRSPYLSGFIDINPFAAMLDAIRTPLLHGTLPGTTSLAVLWTFAVVMACIALVSLRRVEQRMVLWL